MEPATAVHEDRHGRILAELAGLSLALARDLQERALAAETAEEAARLATAFQHISRGVRQTLALELKVIRFRNELDREAKAAAAEAAEAARCHENFRAPAIRARRDSVAHAVERLIYCEPESEETDFDDRRALALQVRLNEWLALAGDRPDFTTTDEDALIIEACEMLGLDPGRLYVFEDEAEPSPDEPAAAFDPEAPAPELEAGVEAGRVPVLSDTS
jgi:hypothetical protein